MSRRARDPPDRASVAYLQTLPRPHRRGFFFTSLGASILPIERAATSKADWHWISDGLFLGIGSQAIADRTRQPCPHRRGFFIS